MNRPDLASIVKIKPGTPLLTDQIRMQTPEEMDAQAQRIAKTIAELARNLGPLPEGEGILITKDGKWHLLPLPAPTNRVDGEEVHVLTYPTTWICPQCWSTAEHDEPITNYQRTAGTYCSECSQLRECHAIEQQR